MITEIETLTWQESLARLALAMPIFAVPGYVGQLSARITVKPRGWHVLPPCS
ncbi:hypothetical protein HQO42_01325 [Rhodococcus fascians]|nr:hypothetical protein [Rhodococcus fascians]MBY4235583.1 hypothetical protein [Rhodococcus fascians]MBY4251274.1 hypothetical protein [Rhodococcus fascians]MBY4266929.1 hypothetical protein [Rhodococcus fascians]